MIGWRVWDVMRTIDWIEHAPGSRCQEVGCVGISGGGTCTQFAAALDTRIKAAFISGYLNTFRDSIMSIEHCIDNYVPGILNWAESYDVAGLIAPRFLFSEGGDKDPIFPVAATRELSQRAKGLPSIGGRGQRTPGNFLRRSFLSWRARFAVLSQSAFFMKITRIQAAGGPRRDAELDLCQG